MAKFGSKENFCYLGLSVQNTLKAIKYILNIAIWTLLGLYTLFILTFQIPAVQEYMGKRAADMLSRKLGTQVSIGRLEYNILSHVTLHHVNIYDQTGKKMLWANRVSARLDLLPLANGKVSVSTAQLFGAFARLSKATADSQPNFQFIIDSLASKDTTSHTPLDLRINSLIVRNSRVSYDQQDVPATPGQLNPKHLQLSDISAHVVLKTLTDDSLNVSVKRMSFKEKSGLDIRRISLKFDGGRHQSRLTDFQLRLPGTHIRLGDIKATYRFRGDHFVVPSLTYSGGILPSSITLSDLACLLPSLKTFNSTLSLEADFNGQGERLELPRLAISSTTGDISINLSGTAQDIAHPQPTWHADIQDLALSAKTVNFITENLQGQHVEVPAVVSRLGSIHLRGQVGGTAFDDIRTRSLLSSEAGSLEMEMALDRQQAFDGKIIAKGVSLRQLLDDDHFGLLEADLTLHGQLGTDLAVNANGEVSQFDYNGYQYRHIGLNGSYSANDIHGQLTVDDPNADLTVDGSLKRQGKAYDVQLNGTVNRLYPQATRLSERWGDADFSGRLTADFHGSSLGDVVGTLDLSDFAMRSESSSYQLRRLQVVSDNDEQQHRIVLDSDFGHAELTGSFDYETLPESFTNFVAAKLPTLPGWPRLNPDTHNNFAVRARIDRSDWMEHLLQVPLTLQEPLTLQGMVNDATRQITLECDVPAFSYSQAGYRHGHVSITSPGDSLHYDLRITKVDDDSPLHLHVLGHAIDNHLTTSLLWDNGDAANPMNGRINATSNFFTAADGQQTAHVNIQPSHLNVYGADWTLEPAYVAYTDRHLDVSGFNIRHGDQHLTVNGTASESAADSLTVDLKDIDVSYVLSLVGFHAVDFDGMATGRGVLRGIFGTLEADARLKVSQFEFEHGRMGTLDARVDWNSAEEQIDIHAVSDDGPDAQTYIGGYVSPGRNFIDLLIRADGTHLDFAQSFTSSFISHVEGHGHGAVNLKGPLDAINLTGELVLNGKARVSTLGCTYEMRNDTLRCTPNEMTFVSCPLYDVYGRQAIMTGGIHHQDLTNLTYDVYVDADQLLAYDFSDFGDDTFYGTVFASGLVAIHGRENEVVIEGDVTPQQGSVLVYNAASPEVITSQEFIQWGTSRPSATALPAHHANYTEETDDFRSDLHMRLHVNTTPESTIRLLMDAQTGDYITLHGSGMLQADYYNKGGFQLFGTYTVSSGTYGVTIQNIIKKNFQFQEGGTIVFGGDPYDATLNMQARHTVGGVPLSDLGVGQSFSSTVRVDCLMNISGQPRAPLIDFDIDLPNVNSDEKQMVRSVINTGEEMNQQVIYLLAVGRFYPQGANNAAAPDAPQQSQTSLAMQSLLSGTVSGQINSMLSQIVNSANWNFGTNISPGDEGWNNAEYEGLVSGRLLNNRLLINGQFGYRDNATTANSSFIGDFDLRYLLTPRGNLALKVYNQTNDRYFTRSSLNTQGIGIIMKKDFNGWRDLFNHKKKH